MPQTQQILNHRYQLIQPLGESASQQTWLASDIAQQPQVTVVVKLLAMSPQMQWEEAKLLEREAQTLQKLSHPRIPQYRDYFMLEQLSDSRFTWFCLVQSQVPGHSLQQLLDEGHHFTEAEVEKIAIEVLSILVYLHELEAPILHRDIKPSNLLWGEDDRLYLIDFGSVQDRAAMEGATFTVVGTYGYVPMEQFSGRAVPASDLYALGATLIHLMTGVPPADLPCQNARIQFADRVGIDPAFVNWVGQLIEPDLADRLSTARLALKALEQRQQLSLPSVNRQPIGSRIQLKKAVDRLEIKIPARGWQALSWLSGVSAIAGSWTILLQIPNIVLNPVFGWFYLALGVFWFVSFVSPALSYSVIQGDRTRFTVYWKLFGFTVWRKRGKTAQIHPVIGLYEQEQWGSKGIMVQAGKTLLSTNPMAAIERLWLMQEIKDWLQAGQPRSSDKHADRLPLQGSRITVNESAAALTIQYPGSEKYWLLTIVPWAFLGVAVICALFPAFDFYAFFSFLPLYIAAKVGERLYAKYFPTQLRVDQNRFVLCKRLLGYTLKLAEGSSATIRCLEQEAGEKLKNKSIQIRSLVIRTVAEDHTFGRGLSQPERYWILEVANRWLEKIRHKK